MIRMGEVKWGLAFLISEGRIRPYLEEVLDQSEMVIADGYMERSVL